MARRRNRGGMTAGVVGGGFAPRAPRAPRPQRPRGRTAGAVGTPAYGAGVNALIAQPKTPTVGTVTAGGPGQAASAPNQIVPDAQYLAEQAQRQFERQQQLNQYNTESANDQSTTTEALRRLIGKVKDDRSNIAAQASRQGLFYSGQLGKRLGDYQTEVTRQQSDLATGLGAREAARAAARTAIAQGASIEEAAALAAAADRQVGLDQADAAAGILATADTTDPTGGGTTGTTSSRRKRRRRTTAGTVGGTGYGAGVGSVLGL